MSAQQFVHLHNHSEFSLLDGAARIDDLFAMAAEMQMPALAMTDHGAMYGALRFYEAGRASGVKPILGVEAYVAPGSRFERAPGESAEKYRHLTILARDERGYRNLLRLVTDAHLEGFYHRARIDKELLAQHADGLIGLSGCLSSEVARAVLDGQEARATEVAAAYGDIFGPGNFYIELQDHGLADQRAIMPGLLRIARSTGLPLVATNDLHYARPADAEPHDVLLCIQQNKQRSDEQRLRFDSAEFYLKTPEQMRALFAEVPEACDNTLAIAEACDLTLTFGELHLPRFEPPDGQPLEGYLRDLVLRGARERYGEPDERVLARIDHELSVIGAMGFAGYFLIVWDLIRFARESGIRVGPGRGSAAGSVVSYCLRITDLDPLRYGLIFERFLNPDRKQMPDIDMDFDERRRDEVIRYVAARYGSDHVAQIITFQTIKGKQGIRDAARVLGHSASVGDKLCKMYPPAVLGRDTPIAEALKESQDLMEAYRDDPEARVIIDTARALEGLRREDSVHAAGVVIGDAPLVNYLPLKLAKDSRDDLRRIVTQFDMHGVEKLGLLKMDFLGLRNLSVIEDTLALLRRRGIELDIDHVPLDDPDVYAMLRTGDTTAVFQLESPGMRQLIQTLAPDRFEDLMALVALYRPGLLSMNQHVEYAERKHGRRPVTYPHPDLEEVLRDTYGIIVYQEQVMQVAVRLAGYSMGEADTLRKVMGKKIRDLLPPHRRAFVEGAVARGIPEGRAREIFELIVPFADYGFNASHACAYGLIAYQTAYLKAHHPVEYMAAMLTSVKDDKDRKPYYLHACRSMGIEVLPPDVNESEMDFAPVAGAERRIRYGLSAVRNVGEGAVAQIIEARRRRGAFVGFADFCRKVDAGVLTKKVLDSLAVAGAFDSFGYARRALLENHAAVSAPILAERRTEAAGQFSLFGGADGAVAADVDESVLVGTEFDRATLLRQEKEVLGQYVTDHPLLAVGEALARLVELPVPDAANRDDGDTVTVGGIVTEVQRKFTKKGEPYALLRLEDLTGGISVVAFPKVWNALGGQLGPDVIAVVKGQVDHRGRETQIRAMEIRLPDLGGVDGGPARWSVVEVDLRAANCTPAVLGRLKECLRLFPGQAQVTVRYVTDSGVTPLEVGSFRVAPDEGLLSVLRGLLGPDSVRVRTGRADAQAGSAGPAGTDGNATSEPVSAIRH